MGDTNNKDMNQNGMDMEQIKEYGQAVLNNPKTNHDIHLLNIIGEIEGHECLPSTTKTTKYEHVLPQLAVIEDSEKVDGLLLILNTVGGDVESGLAIAEMWRRWISRRCPWFLGDRILLGYRWRCLRIIRLLCRAGRW